MLLPYYFVDIYRSRAAIVTGRKRTRRSSSFLLKEGGKYDRGYFEFIGRYVIKPVINLVRYLVIEIIIEGIIEGVINGIRKLRDKWRNWRERRYWR